MTLAFLAYETSRLAITENLTLFRPWLGNFDIVWGPAFHEDAFHQPDAMTYIARNGNRPDQFYVAIRGTAPRTLTEWIFQDFWVGAMVDWEKVPYDGLLPPDPPGPGQPAISFGTNNAMHILINHLKDSVDILTFLQDQARQSRKPLTICITGHSLGGVLASTFALYLLEHWPSDIPKAKISAFGYAAPTAGNQSFAAYSNRMIGKRCKIYANPLDVVSRVWEIHALPELPTLYKPLTMPAVLSRILQKIAIPAVQGKEYTPIDRQLPLIPSRVVESGFLKEYVLQMAFQHLLPYLAELVRIWPQGGRELLIERLDSWETVESFKRLEPLPRGPEKNLRFYLNLLSGEKE